MISENALADNIAGLIQIAKWISFLIISGAALSACVCVLRFLKQPEFTLGQLKLSISMFPYVVVAFTSAHLFLTWVFFQRVTLLRAAGSEISKQAWNKLITSEAFVFFNMRPRIWNKTAGPFRTGTYIASSADTAFWSTFAFATVLLAAIVASRLSYSPSLQLQLRPSAQQAHQRVLGLVALACVLALFNWVIGSQWSIAASSLLR